MANVTQTIPNLTQGISQQPDEYKVPGQVTDMINALPDVTQGLLKRPAGKFVASLSDGTNNSYTTGKWFHYYRDENEQYIGQVIRRKNSDGSSHADDGKIRIWDCQTGAEKTVVNGIGNFDYLKHTDDEDIQTLTLNDFTYINNRSIETEMDTSSAGIEPLGNFGKEVFIELKKIAYAKQYSLNVFNDTSTAPTTTATRISVDLVRSSNNYCDSNYYMQDHADRGLAVGAGSNTRCGKEAGDGRDAYAPNVGTRIFSVDSGITLVDTAATGGLKVTNINANPPTTVETEQNYEYPVQIFKKAFGGNYTQAQNSSTVTVTTSTAHGLSSNTQMYFDFTTQTNGSLNLPNDGYATITVTGATTFTFTHPNGNNSQSGNLAGNVNSSETNQPDRKNLYFRIATTGQSVPYTEGSGNNQSTNYQARYTTSYDLLHGGDGWQQGDYFYVWMKDAYYKITIETISTSDSQANLALVRPQPTPFDTETTITAEGILGDLRTEILAATDSSGNANFASGDVTIIGTGLHIKRTTAFNASTPVGELLNVVSGKVNDVGDLPSQCKHGMVVEVVNSVAEEDNHFVKFFGKLKTNGDPDNDADYLDGEGTWEECAKPGRKIRLKRSKMPVLLIRTADGNFRLTELDGSNYTISGNQYSAPQWDDALVGDDVTNPEPSFIGKNISKMVFFRNRFTILADENIVMSRPGDFTNFFAKSAIQLIASDPIDISASSEYPAILYDGIQVNTGLILFSKNQQFMLTTDSDVFSPTTAKINALSTYNFNFATNPISLGTTVGFLDNAGKFSRFFEMAQVQREGEPEVIEQSAVVSRLFEKDLKLISNSRENSVIFFSEEGTSTLYGYRYFDNIRERKLASWFKWTVTGTIQYHCMQDDNLYVVVRNNGKDQLLKYAIKMDANTALISGSRIHLDHLMETSGWSYNASTQKSTKAKPTGLESSNQLVAYDEDTGNNLGRYGKITVNGSNLELDGDWSNETFFIGYQFTMQVDLPTIYVTRLEGEAYRVDSRSNTIIHRIKFGFGPIGLYKTILNRIGKNTFEQDIEVTNANTYLANTAAIRNDNKLYAVPVYDRNTNVTLTVKSEHPAPANILYLIWEGAYNNNFYTRV